MAKRKVRRKVRSKVTHRKKTNTVRKKTTRTKKTTYSWDQCIKDQTKRYGSKKVARKVCGAIRAKARRR